jgi:hypothetical protein
LPSYFASTPSDVSHISYISLAQNSYIDLKITRPFNLDLHKTFAWINISLSLLAMLIVISLQIMLKLKIEAAENSALKTMVIDSSLIHLALLGAQLQHHFHAHDDYHNFPVVRDARSDLKVRKERTRPDR